MNLLDLLNRNHYLFCRMKRLASKQKKLIETDNVYEFLGIMSQRKRIQQEISSNERRYEKQKKKRIESDLREKVRELTSDIKEMVLFIQQVDQRTEGLLENRKGDLSSEIMGFRKGQKALKGYGNFNVKSPRFIDRQG